MTKKMMCALLVLCMIMAPLLSSCGGRSAAPSASLPPSDSTVLEAVLPEEVELGTQSYGWIKCKYKDQEVERRYTYYIPEDYQPGEQLPLMLTLHGSGDSAAGQLGHSSWRQIADRERIIIISPEAVGIKSDRTLTSKGMGLGALQRADASYLRWNVTDNDPAYVYQIDDVEYLCTLVDLFVDAGYADPARLFVSGLSQGGYMSLKLLFEAPGKFAGAAPVAALLLEEYNELPLEGDPVVIMVNGTADPIVPYDGVAIGKLVWAKSVESSIDWFVEYKGLKGDPLVTPIEDVNEADGCTMSTIAYTDEQGQISVMHIKVENGGHTWPGGFSYAGSGPVCLDAMASEMIWDVFRDVRNPNVAK